ncbi:PH domain-containing protein [Microbacterium sp. X-17]|uniref:PH domain-containing protein n=1 Tax=Microbacterium sp. X-17 TaxID=3144404 RepID=UPI0031F53F88
MTNTPETAGPGSPTGTDPELSGLDARTFHGIPEPRSAARLPLGTGEWHQLARSYVWVRLITTSAALLVVVALGLGITFLTSTPWPWIPLGTAGFVLVWMLAITPRQVRAFGYQLRENDLLMRRGILWQRMIAVPYGRMQLVDVAHGPLDRGFGIAQLKLVTAAATSAVVLPGLTQAGAELLRDTLVQVAESRRTGL